jgi:hypothetical protein
MRNTVAKALRKKAFHNMEGGRKGSPRQEYKRLKKVYKSVKGEV